jgi:hypothetical protein
MAVNLKSDLFLTAVHVVGLRMEQYLEERDVQ